MRLDRMSWPELERRLATGRRGVILPLGSLEQHGAAGLLGTDTLCAEAVALRATEIAGGLVAPALPYGPAQFNLGFPGTVSLRPSTLMALLVDALTSLGHGGFTRVLLLTGHGGNTAPALAAIQELLSDVSLGRLGFPLPLSVKLRAWWEGPRCGALRRELYGDREGFHATPSEVAIALHVTGAAPRPWPPFRPLAPDPLVDPGGDRHEDAARHRARHPDGQVGSDPALATAEHGAALLRAAAEDVAETFLAFESAAEPGHS
ncbi:creatininase family protein [Falsiroseomonas oryzae]|uniref:creatininase family protein n=1 Tax=Falsiroseomonas oryzae TaxID=2766473 RepID=UPI0022EA52A1|nr:creatininase family protein [Roseomonas sp. MO-31]